MPGEWRALPSSFRDPSGFLFEREGGLYRQVNRYYQDDYDLLLSSGLYKALTEQGLLVRHDEAASAFNIQFVDGRPLLVDTLSFEKLRLRPWVAYRQFCQHFLNPLLLIAYKDFHLNQLSRIFIDGIPMSLTSRLLPFRTRLRPGLASHVHLHALSQKYFSTRKVKARERQGRRGSSAGLVGRLE